MKLRDTQPTNPVYQFASVLVIKCQDGKYVNYESYLDQVKDTFEIICGYGGKWLPDPVTDLSCDRKLSSGDLYIIYAVFCLVLTDGDGLICNKSPNMFQIWIRYFD